MLRKKRYQNILTKSMLTKAIFYQPEPFLLLDWANKGSGKIGKRYSLLSGLLKLIFTTTHYYCRFDICRRDKRRKWPQRNRSTKCWDKARHHTRTPRNFIGGNPTGSAVKTNGRAGTRESGSSKGSPEVGLANDGWELSTENKTTGEHRVNMVQEWAYQLKWWIVSVRRKSCTKCTTRGRTLQQRTEFRQSTGRFEQ